MQLKLWSMVSALCVLLTSCVCLILWLHDVRLNTICHSGILYVVLGGLIFTFTLSAIWMIIWIWWAFKGVDLMVPTQYNSIEGRHQ